MIRDSWRRDDGSLYGRLDLSYGGSGDAKLLEYNADTPTSIFEAAVFQWTWLEQGIERRLLDAGADQFNSLHERLIEAWKELGGNDRAASGGNARQSGRLRPRSLISRTRRNKPASRPRCLPSRASAGVSASGFVDLDDEKIALAFKLYPWEWMFHDAFGERIAGAPTRWIEPPWKAILSNKGLLALLWEMFPGHPNLLPAFFEDEPNAKSLSSSFVRKPLLSREGANVAIVRHGDVVAESKARMGPRASFARRSRRCRIFPVNIRCSEAGSSITCLAVYRSARTKIRSRATRRAFCRTRSFEADVAQRAYRAATAATFCGIMPARIGLDVARARSGDRARAARDTA